MSCWIMDTRVLAIWHATEPVKEVEESELDAGR